MNKDENGGGVFTSPASRVVAAAVLPILSATAVSQALTFAFLRGIDGAVLSFTWLWTLLWVVAFFHCFLAKTATRVWAAQAGAIAFALLPLLWSRS